MNKPIKFLFLFIALTLVSSPFVYSLIRVTRSGDSGGGGGVPSDSSPSTLPSQLPSVVSANSAGQCPAGYRCNACVKI